ncbi:hypothetical protein MMC13_001021 [Lambiella insularis]|nr:hypothetical protein [Lambiella insularis]
MADPVSIVGTLIAIGQASAAVTKYLRDVKSSSLECKRLLLDVKVASGIARIVQDLVEEATPSDVWARPLKSLGVPLREYHALLEQLSQKLEPRHGLRKIVNASLWSLRKAEIEKILVSVERYKTAFLTTLQTAQTQCSREIKNDTGRIEKNLEQTRTDVIEIRDINREREFSQMLSWLCPLDFQAKQNVVYNGCHPGTCDWIFEHHLLGPWLVGRQKAIWCRGILGAGKTVLSSVIINHLTTENPSGDVGIAYVYCSYKERDTQTADRLKASLARQLICQQPALYQLLLDIYHKHRNGQTSMSPRDLAKILDDIVTSFKKVFLIVDGMDECSEKSRDSFLARLARLQNHSNACLLVTSRPNCYSVSAQIADIKEVEIRASSQDARNYLASRITDSERLSRFTRENPGLQESMIDTVVTKSAGMFLLVQLHIEALTSCKTLRAVKNSLQGLSSELDDVYDDAMQRIREQNKEDACLGGMVLSWVSYARSPLKVRELQHALATSMGQSESDFDKDAILNEEDLVGCCAGLVGIEKEHSTVKLVHFSTQEYFERNRGKLPADAQKEIARTCLKYLSFERPPTDIAPRGEDYRVPDHDKPFLEYAVTYWADHVRGPLESVFLQPILSLLNYNGKSTYSAKATNYSYMRNWYIEAQKSSETNFGPWCGPSEQFSMHNLAIAAHFGLTVVMTELLNQGSDVNERQCEGFTALIVAIIALRLDVVKILVERGANVHSCTKEWSPLHFAALNDTAIVRFLLEHDSTIVNFKDSGGRTPLFNAAIACRLYAYAYENCKLLIEYGADISALDNEGRTPWAWAERNRGSDKIMSLLAGPLLAGPGGVEGE